MPPNNGPQLSPEEAAKASALIELLGEGIAQNWWKKGYWIRFAELVSKQNPGAGSTRASPSVPCHVKRFDEDGTARTEQTTVGDLLAEIADNQLDTLDAINALTETLSGVAKKRRRRRR